MKLKYLSWLPAVIIMGIIFNFSSKPAVISAQGSLNISKVIISIYVDATNTEYLEPTKQEMLNVIDHLVRKSAHFIEYAGLAAALAFHFTLWKKSKRWRLLLPILISTLYAASDEFHQRFVPGRSGQLSDVLLDSTGAVTGALCIYLLVAICARLGNKTLN